MKLQTIEKAANDFMNDFCYDHIDNSAINNEEDNYEAGKNHALLDYGNDIFIAGAKWRINSVWHDRTEKADISKELILMYSNGSVRVTLLNPNLTFDGFLSVDMFIKWAYVSDILPERKEE